MYTTAINSRTGTIREVQHLVVAADLAEIVTEEIRMVGSDSSLLRLDLPTVAWVWESSRGERPSFGVIYEGSAPAGAGSSRSAHDRPRSKFDT